MSLVSPYGATREITSVASMLIGMMEINGDLCDSLMFISSCRIKANQGLSLFYWYKDLLEMFLSNAS